jgi:hypothetical protein
MRMAHTPTTARNKPIVLRIDQLSSKYAGTPISVAQGGASFTGEIRMGEKEQTKGNF